MVVELPARQKYLNYLTESRRRRKFLPVPLAEVAYRITISFLCTFAALVFDPAFATVQG